MHYSRNSSAKSHEIKHFLAALDKLGEIFGHNRDTYYSLGRYYVTQLLKSSLTMFLNFYSP